MPLLPKCSLNLKRTHGRSGGLKMPFAGNLIFGLAIDTYIMSHDLIKMSYNLIVTKVNKKSSKYKITILDIWNRSQK